MDFDGKVALLTTLGGNQQSTLGSTRSIENYSRGTLQQSYLVDFGWQHVVCITHHSVNDNEIFSVSPDVAIETTDHIVNIVQAVAAVGLVLQLLHINDRDTSHHILLVHRAESHIDECRV